MTVVYYASNGVGWGHATRAAAIARRLPDMLVVRANASFNEPLVWSGIPFTVSIPQAIGHAGLEHPELVVWDSTPPWPTMPAPVVYVWRHGRPVDVDADLHIAADWPPPPGYVDCWPIVSIDRGEQCACEISHSHLDVTSVYTDPDTTSRLMPLAPHLARTAKLTGRPGANLWAEAYWLGVPDITWLEPIAPDQKLRIRGGFPADARERPNGADTAAAAISELR